MARRSFDLCPDETSVTGDCVIRLDFDIQIIAVTQRLKQCKLG